MKHFTNYLEPVIWILFGVFLLTHLSECSAAAPYAAWRHVLAYGCAAGLILTGAVGVWAQGR